MSLDAVVRKVARVADKVTTRLQATVKHRAWLKNDEYGAAVFASATDRLAVVDREQKIRQTSSGQEILTIASVLFPRPVTPNGAAGRIEPIDQRDTITLPDGTTGPIVDVNVNSGVIDPTTGRPYVTEVLLGVPK